MTHKVLVTGANGLLGSEFRRKIPPDWALFCDRQKLDVTDINMVRAFVQENPTNIIINCAANCNAEYLETHPEESIKINEIAPQNLAIVANEIGATLIHFSSDYVFNGEKTTPYVENDQTQPLSVYGKSKERSEKYLLKYCNSVLIFRVAWLFSEFGHDFVKTVYSLAEKRELKVIFDQVGSPSYAADVAKHIVEILPHINYGMKEVYHLTNEGVCSWYDLSHFIVHEFGLHSKIIPIHTAEYKQKAIRPSYSVLDKEKVKRDFNVQIRHFTDALHECITRIKAQ